MIIRWIVFAIDAIKLFWRILWRGRYIYCNPSSGFCCSKGLASTSGLSSRSKSFNASFSGSGSGPKTSSFSRSDSGPKISSLSRHTETWSLPLTAIREAIINAVVHADYAQQGAPIRLSIFDDRIEIENPGLLLFGLTVDEIKEGVSKLRNRVIGQVFHRLGLIERWGSGVRRIIDSCKELGFAEPLFEEIGTHFRVTIFTQPVTAPSLDEIEYAIIEILKDRNGLSTKEISEKIGKSVRATRVRLNVLIEKGLIIIVGSGVNDPQRKYFLS